MEKIGESSTGVMDVGLMRTELPSSFFDVVEAGISEDSSPVLIPSSDLLAYFLP